MSILGWPWLGHCVILKVGSDLELGSCVVWTVPPNSVWRILTVTLFHYLWAPQVRFLWKHQLQLSGPCSLQLRLLHYELVEILRVAEELAGPIRHQWGFLSPFLRIITWSTYTNLWLFWLVRAHLRAFWSRAEISRLFLRLFLKIVLVQYCLNHGAIIIHSLVLARFELWLWFRQFRPPAFHRDRPSARHFLSRGWWQIVLESFSQIDLIFIAVTKATSIYRPTSCIEDFAMGPLSWFFDK